jgi:hypothetical protein
MLGNVIAEVPQGAGSRGSFMFARRGGKGASLKIAWLH